MRSKIEERSNLIFFVILVLIQVFRIFHGLDFNDEMQYFGEMKSILESEKLFQADLYFQQIVYLYIYPLLKYFYKEDQSFGLILQLRLVLALFVFVIYIEIFKNLSSFGLSKGTSSFIALCATFAIPIGNIYSVSYNTISIGLLALVFSEYLNWDVHFSTKKTIKLSFITVVLLMIYPTLGLIVGIMVCARFISKRMDSLLIKYMLSGILFSVLSLFCLFRFTNFQDLKESLVFTGSFGVGRNFFSSRMNLIFYFEFYLIIGLLVFLKWKDITKDIKTEHKYLVYVLYLLIFISFLTLLAIFEDTNSIKPLIAPTLALISFAITISTIRKSDFGNNCWNIVIFLSCCGIISFTSSNGLQQFQWPSMLAPIFSLSYLMKNEKLLLNKTSVQLTLCVVFFVAYNFLFLNYPYRDQKIWDQHAHFNVPSGIRGINISSEKLDALLRMREILKDVKPTTKLMVIGAHPWIYLATNSKIDTDMIFMHNTGSDVAYSILGERILRRTPDFIIFTSEINNKILESTELIIGDQYVCTFRKLGDAFKDVTNTIKTFYTIFDELRVCKRRGVLTP